MRQARRLVGALLLTLACGGPEGDPPNRTIKSPTVKNRAALLAQRDSLGKELLQPGDSVKIRVFVLIDEHGVPRGPEIKQEIDPRIARAALDLVLSMRFNPAIENGKPKAVLMTVPVNLGN
ncbi:MAG: energy transducer TonB [Gemmatimonadota bacterium]